MVEFQPSKLAVAGSNPVARSSKVFQGTERGRPEGFLRNRLAGLFYRIKGATEARRVPEQQIGRVFRIKGATESWFHSAEALIRWGNDEGNP